MTSTLYRDVDAHFHAGAEDDAFGFHLLHPLIDMDLLHLEVGDAIAQQAAHTVGLLEDGDGVTGARQLLGAGEAGRARTDDGHPLAGAARRGLGRDPAFLPALVDDLAFDRLDRHWRVYEVERAGLLAGRRADAAGELGKVVRRLQVVQRQLPLVAID